MFDEPGRSGHEAIAPLGMLRPVLLGALCAAIPSRPAAAAEEPLAQIFARAKHGDVAASQSRALGWAGVVIGAVNLAVLALVAARWARHGIASPGSAQAQIRALRQRQELIGRSVATLNQRLGAYFQSTEDERKELGEVLKAINDQLRETAADMEKIARPARPETAAKAD